MNHKSALQQLEDIVNEKYLPEVCERVMMNHKKVRVELKENVSYHVAIEAGMPVIIRVNFSEKHEQLNTLLRDALLRIRKDRLAEPFPLVPKEYYKNADTNGKWRMRKLASHKGQQSMFVSGIPKKDIEFKRTVITEVTDKITGLTVRTEEISEDIKDMSAWLWMKLSENVKELEEKEEDDSIKAFVSETPELDKAIEESQNAANN